MTEQLLENWEGFVAAIVSISAFIAIFLSAPEDDSSSFYTIFYNIINYFAFNFGKATNADDANTSDDTQSNS